MCFAYIRIRLSSMIQPSHPCIIICPFSFDGHTPLRFRLVHVIHFMQFLRHPPVHLHFPLRFNFYILPWNHSTVSSPELMDRDGEHAAFSRHNTATDLKFNGAKLEAIHRPSVRHTALDLQRM